MVLLPVPGRSLKQEAFLAQDGKLNRRIIGMLSARIPEVGLESVVDPRDDRGKEWRSGQLLSAMLIGAMAGCKSLADVEMLSSELSVGARRRLKIPRRVPDTTMRDVAVGLAPEDICRLIRESGQREIDAKRSSRMASPSMSSRWTAKARRWRTSTRSTP